MEPEDRNAPPAAEDARLPSAAAAPARAWEPSAAPFRDFAEALTDLVWSARPDGVSDYYNRRFLGYLGRTLEEMQGWTWAETLHPDDAPRAGAAWAAACTGGLEFEVEYRIRRHDGVYRWHRGHAAPVRDAAGRIVRWFGTCTDIDDRKRAEDQWLQAKEAAEAANRAKDAFLAALSHELRMPLTPALLSVSALEADPRLPADLRDELRLVRRNVEIEARLIDDLLDLTRIAQGKMSFDLERVDAHAKVLNSIDICRGDLTARRLHLDVQLRARRHHVRADGARLQQVFWNLLTNAAKFTPEGGTVTVATEDGDGDCLRILVADTGIGIAPDVLPHVFEAFEQGGPETTRRFGGLGLGLAISRAIVEAHCGTLTARSGGRGTGATFTVELTGATAVAPAGPSPPTAAAPRRQGLRILLVEDHRDTARVMARLLSRAGHAVTTAGSVAAATDAAAAGPFDLLLCDLGLPDGSGLALMERLKPLPGIALTGYGMDEDVKKAHEAGFLAHLTKPINLRQLEATIEEVALDI